MEDKQFTVEDYVSPNLAVEYVFDKEENFTDIEKEKLAQEMCGIKA